ncbi:MAG: choice-of-anchor V domain-containing protein [Bacteroidota bacterium]
MHHQLKIAVLASFLVLTGIYSALTSSGGAPLGYSSAPGESNCTSCHGGLAVNSGPATRTLTFNGSAASSYAPGQTYNLSLTVTRATRNKYGFQLKVEDGQGGDAGTLISTTNRTWLQQGYLNQSGSGNTSTSSGTITWNFQWTAPAAGTGPVTFYFSSNAANNNGSTSGDEIYTDAVTLLESSPSYMISGLLQYDNTAGTPVVNSTVRLLGTGGNVLQTATTNATGQYTFSNVPSGSYSVSALSSRPWGGVSSADALLITRQFNNTINLSGLRLVSADVNGSNSISSADALLVSRRVAGLISSFSAGDWKFETVPVNVINANITQNIRGICLGDVNASFQPSTVRHGTVALELNPAVVIPSQGAWVPLSLKGLGSKDGIPLGSVTLDLEVPQGWQIEGVRSALKGMMPEYSLEGNRMRLSWFDLEGMNLGLHEPILYLKVLPNQESPAVTNPWSLFSSSELTDQDGNVLGGLSVVLPRLQTAQERALWIIQPVYGPGTCPQVMVSGQGTLELRAIDVLGRVLDRRTLQHSYDFSEMVLFPEGTAVVSGVCIGSNQAPILARVAF